ncbi:hypothetical protein Bca52824_033428 [Brassica carinata]|uniref:Uncharacterized protein n=1 Tax=Brassica carinata TaxID=52824 RepID=A0A8X7SEB0_BRACI|nr:hypothetical protein Bca52824_033428 [Brassica carinata]
MKLSHESSAFFWWDFDRTLGVLTIVLSNNVCSSCFLPWIFVTDVYSAREIHHNSHASAQTWFPEMMAFPTMPSSSFFCSSVIVQERWTQWRKGLASSLELWGQACRNRHKRLSPTNMSAHASKTLFLLGKILELGFEQDEATLGFLVSYLSELSELRLLDLSDNHLKDELPSEISKLSGASPAVAVPFRQSSRNGDVVLLRQGKQRTLDSVHQFVKKVLEASPCSAKDIAEF